MSESLKIYITGASCSGVSTLGAALSTHLHIPHLDVDNFYWMPTDPPFTTKRLPKDRVTLIQNQQAQSTGWVLTGSFIGWGDTLINDVNLIVFLQTPTAIRLARLDKREMQRHGSRIAPGGDMHEAHLAFRSWAASYDDPSFSGRNLAQHELWLSVQNAPILRLHGEQSTEELMRSIIDIVAHGFKPMV